jgi:tetratricopeptide (TPR) repeat protein
LDGDLAGGRAFLAHVLGGTGTPTPARAQALYGDGLLALRSGAVDDSRRRNDEALAVARTLADREGLVLSLLGLSRLALEDGDHERARTLAREARLHADALDPAMSQGPLHTEAQALRALGDLEAAAALFENSLELNRRIGDDGMVEVERHNLGHVELRRGRVDAAERLFAQIPAPAPDDDYGLALADVNCASVALARGDEAPARAFLQAALARLDRSGTVLAPDDQAEVDRLRGFLRAGD